MDRAAVATAMSIILPAEALARASDSQLVTLTSAIETELTRRAAEAAQPGGPKCSKSVRILRAAFASNECAAESPTVAA